jgi:hypothetical protein
MENLWGAAIPWSIHSLVLHQSCYGQQYAESPISNLQGATSTVACGQQSMLSSSDQPPEHLKWLKSFLSLGFSRLLFLKMKDFIGTE